MDKPKQAKPTLTRARAVVPRSDGKPGKANDISWHDAFIKALGTTANVHRACMMVGVNRTTAYDHKKRFSEFSAQWEDAEQCGLDIIFSTLLDHAANGTVRSVYQGGFKVGEERVFDHRLGEWLLQRKRPDDFGDKSKLELSGPPRRMTPEEVEVTGQKAEASIIALLRRDIHDGMKREEKLRQAQP